MGHVASLKILVSKQDLLFTVAVRFAICNIILLATLFYYTLYPIVFVLSYQDFPHIIIVVNSHASIQASPSKRASVKCYHLFSNFIQALKDPGENNFDENYVREAKHPIVQCLLGIYEHA